MDLAESAVGAKLHIVHLPGDGAAFAGSGEACVLDRVFQVEQHPRLGTFVPLMH